MSEKSILTREQVFFLVFISSLGNMVYSHTWIDDATNRAAWVAAFVGILLVIPFAVWISYLGQHHPGGTVFDILEASFGKLPCFLVSVVYILINIGVAVAMLNMFTQLLKTFFIMFTPVWIIMSFMVLIAGMFVYGGLKAFARTVEMLTVLGLMNYFVSFVHVFPSYIHTEYIYPIFDTSLLGFIKGAAFMAGAASECLLLLIVIVAFIPEPGKHYLWAVYGLAFCAVIFTSAILIINAMLSPELAKRIAFGGVNAAKIIQIGDFLQGLEVFIFGTYQFLALGKITICLYCAWTSSKKIFNNWRPGIQLVLTSLIILVPSVWLNSYNKAFQLAVLLGYIILPFCAGILLLASLGILINKKRTGSSAK